jgi:anti-sigma regulatory factor (Ser/Thr protein kinase)
MYDHARRQVVSSMIDTAHMTAAWPRVSCLELGPLPTAVGCAREHARAVLLEWDLGALADDAATLVSELMTNAMKASRALKVPKPIALRLLANHQQLIIEVWDQNPNDPRPRAADADSEGGRGLAVIEAYSNRWGYRRVSANLKVVWCELTVP